MQVAYEKLLPKLQSDSVPINPYRVAYELNEFLTDGNRSIVLNGGDVVTALGARGPAASQPGHWMDPEPLDTLGDKVPYRRWRAKYAHPESERALLFGDGAFTLNDMLQFETCQRFKLPILGVIGNELGDEPDSLRADQQVRRRARQRRRPARPTPAFRQVC